MQICQLTCMCILCNCGHVCACAQTCASKPTCVYKRKLTAGSYQSYLIFDADEKCQAFVQLLTTKWFNQQIIGMAHLWSSEHKFGVIVAWLKIQNSSATVWVLHRYVITWHDKERDTMWLLYVFIRMYSIFILFTDVTGSTKSATSKVLLNVQHLDIILVFDYLYTSSCWWEYTYSSA